MNAATSWPGVIEPVPDPTGGGLGDPDTAPETASRRVTRPVRPDAIPAQVGR